MEDLFNPSISQKDLDNLDEAWKTRSSNGSGLVAALLKQKLISAVKNGNKYIVKSVLDEIFNTSDVFAKSWSSDSQPEPEKQKNKFEVWRDAMYIAMKKDTKRSKEIIKLLLDWDVIWSLKTKMNDLLLHRLIGLGEEVDDRKLRLIELILASGKINVNATDKYGCTAMHYAEKETLISLLIHYGADVSKMPARQGARCPNFFTASKEVKTLMDLDAMDGGGRTALMTAVILAQPGEVDLLLKAGASVNLSDNIGHTALHHALHISSVDYLHYPRNSEELKKRKEIFTIVFDAKEENQCDGHMRHKEIITKKIEIIQMLLRKKDIDVNALSFDKFSPLDMAEIQIPQLPSFIINALEEKGAVLNAFRETESQSTGDFHLDARCRLALQQLLRNVSGYTTIKPILSVDLFKKRCLTLIEAFQDQIVSGKDMQGRTALHLAVISYSIIHEAYNCGSLSGGESSNNLRDLGNTIVKELIAIGCSVNETDIYGRTPMHYANKLLLKDSLMSHGADGSIEDKDGYSAIDEVPNQSSTPFYDLVEAVIDRADEAYFLRLFNNRQMEIQVQVRASDDRQFRHEEVRRQDIKTVPRLLWEKSEYAFRHPSAKQITKEVIDTIDIIAKEIEKLDPRFEIRHQFDGSSNEGTRLGEPDEFDFCVVLTKISELCEVSLSPELPPGFVRIKRKPTKAGETDDFDNFFRKDGMLNTEQLKWQFLTIFHSSLVNIQKQKGLDCNLEMKTQEFNEAVNKTINFNMMRPLNSTSVSCISVDIIPCIHVDGWWPDDAISNVSDEMKNSACNLVFDRPQDLYPWVPYSESCARISFAKGESDMIKQSCSNAREAYMIGKTMVGSSESDYIGSSQYALKNCLLYCIEALTPTTEKASQLGLSLEEMESKFHQMDRYLWLKCLMKCRLDFISQDFCPCYFLPYSSSPTGHDPHVRQHLKELSLDWMTDTGPHYPIDPFPKLCKKAYALYRCTSNDTSESCCQLSAPDPLLERFDRNQLIASLCEIAYNNLKLQ